MEYGATPPLRVAQYYRRVCCYAAAREGPVHHLPARTKPPTAILCEEEGKKGGRAGQGRAGQEGGREGGGMRGSRVEGP
eukprot:1076223-Rhodomonas_salina.6